MAEDWNNAAEALAAEALAAAIRAAGVPDDDTLRAALLAFSEAPCLATADELGEAAIVAYIHHGAPDPDRRVWQATGEYAQARNMPQAGHDE